MRNIAIIAKRELRSYFDSPVAYIVIVAFLLVAGWMYFGSLFLMGRADLRSFFTPSPFSPATLIVMLAPAVTMRLIAEERKSGTLELIATLPLTDAEVILGKFLAAWALLAIGLAMTLVYAVTVSFMGDLDWGPVLSGYVGMLLFAGALLSVGLLTSTWTQNQIVAFIIGFLICSVLYYIYWLQFFVPQLIAPAVEYLSMAFHLDNMARGVMDTRDVCYYLTVVAGALVLAVRSLQQQHA